MAFLFCLETQVGSPADPATLKAAVPNWSSQGTESRSGRGRFAWLPSVTTTAINRPR
jgi:hypothetical protein